MTAAERIGGNIRRIRRAADITQEALALDAEISRPSMTMYERGKRLPRLDVLLKLAAVLEVEPGTILEGVRWETATYGTGRFVFDEEDR
jgi:transcriptional regulator with XRE-family HTH domain